MNRFVHALVGVIFVCTFYISLHWTSFRLAATSAVPEEQHQNRKEEIQLAYAKQSKGENFSDDGASQVVKVPTMVSV